MPTVPRETFYGHVPVRDVRPSEIDLIHLGLDRAIDLREAMVRIADPYLLTMTDALLFELGRRLARLEGTLPEAE